MGGHQKGQILQLFKSLKDLEDGIFYQRLQLKVILHTKFITDLLQAAEMLNAFIKTKVLPCCKGGNIPRSVLVMDNASSY